MAKTQLSSVKWPKQVPYLTARDFCRNTNFDGHDRCCLMGHANLVFCGQATGIPVDCDRRARDRALKAIILAAKASPPKKMPSKTVFTDHYIVTAFNDDRGNSLSKLAEIWNKAMELLGYTEWA